MKTITYDYYELRNDGRGDYSVLGFSTYTSGVLKGAPKKVRVDGFETSSDDVAMELAEKGYGEMNWYNQYLSASAESHINSLPE